MSAPARYQRRWDAYQKAVVQLTKQASAYVFDRVTGKPVWPIEERPLPQSEVPGEKTWRTQPLVTKPAPFDVQGVATENLIDFTPERRNQALEIVKQYRLGPLFSPPSLVNAPDAGATGRTRSRAIRENSGLLTALAPDPAVTELSVRNCLPA